MLIGLAVLSAVIWLYLVLAHGQFWRVGMDAPAQPARTPPVIAVVPARNEAEVIGHSISCLLAQTYPGLFRVLLVDDHSDDGTAERALEAAKAAGALDRLDVLRAAPLPPGWTGKVWAMEQGRNRAAVLMPDAEFVLFTDADIVHEPENLARLAAKAETGRLDLTSQMVRLHCASLAERALIPAFVFFFAMLYPFRWVGDPGRRTAAAAGGCMLVRRTALDRIGGMAAIRSALIDDCALAGALKPHGLISLSLTRSARSLRFYPRFGDVWRMVARTAYTELRYQPLRLVGTVLGISLVFLVPPLLVLLGGSPAREFGIVAWLLMALAYGPMVRFYGLSPLWVVVLPLVAAFYLSATLDSARRHWQGRGGEWKGRVQSASRT